ncbi:DUF3313 domain-containing protein [Brevundimonas sp.]|uniref:DUF3313 domain-containing protein n=1 Tax=Brevundimonas sp. TaxID=1871086 RepID=UPI0025D00664|nr:DUF3313 domain-containing protein [Brevundimonas sp.]
MRRAALIVGLAGLTGACATAQQGDAGFLTGYGGLTPRSDTLRVAIRERADQPALVGVTAVFIEPAALYPPGQVGQGLSQEERAAVLAEVDRQLCYELSERYDILAEPRPDAPRVRAAVTRIEATGQAGSVVSAAASWFIPGPIGVRPGGLGALAAEAEMLDQDRQIAAISWARQATAVGTDTPSLSRVGDALQFAEPFADDAAAIMTAEGREARPIPDPDPCARFGPRTRPAGFIARFATGLYVPELSTGGAEEPGTEER